MIQDKMPLDYESMLPQNIGEKHVPCVLLVDISGSMIGRSMEELNEGLLEFGTALEQDEQARGCADICVISFSSGIRTEVPFCPAANYISPQLSAGGLTSMNQAILEGLYVIEERKNLYKSYGISYFRPWMFLLTDGEPTDTGHERIAKQKLIEAIRGRKLNFFPMGIGNANIIKLKSYTPDGSGIVLKASASNFKEAFVWLSNSIGVVTNSTDAEAAIPMPAMPPMIEIL